MEDFTRQTVKALKCLIIGRPIRIVIQSMVFLWFICLVIPPTCFVIRDQCLAIFVDNYNNSRDLKVIDWYHEQHMATKEEEERILKDLETPEGRQMLEEAYDEEQESGMTVKKACQLGIAADPKYCQNPESMDAVFQTKEEYMAELDNWKEMHEEMQSKRKDSAAAKGMLTEAANVIYYNTWGRIVCIVVHLVLIPLELSIILDKSILKSKAANYGAYVLTFILYFIYIRYYVKKIQDIANGLIDPGRNPLEILIPRPIGIEEGEGNYHLGMVVYVTLDAFYSFYSNIFKEPLACCHETKGKRRKGQNKKSFKKEAAELSKFHHYCAQGDKVKVKEVIRNHQHQIDINATKDGNNTVIHLAVKGEHHEVVQILVSNFEHQLDISLRNEQGYNVLDLAVIKKKTQIFSHLLKHSQPRLSSLILALETFQEQYIKSLKSRLSRDLEVDIRYELDVLCGQVKESKKKNLRHEGRETIKGNLDVRQKMIIQYLASKEHNLPSSIVKKSKAERLREEFECPICQEDMRRPLQIFGCTNDHLLCSECLKDPRLKACPICREDFASNRPQRRTTTEKLVENLS